MVRVISRVVVVCGMLLTAMASTVLRGEQAGASAKLSTKVSGSMSARVSGRPASASVGGDSLFIAGLGSVYGVRDIGTSTRWFSTGIPGSTLRESAARVPPATPPTIAATATPPTTVHSHQRL